MRAGPNARPTATDLGHVRAGLAAADAAGPIGLPHGDWIAVDAELREAMAALGWRLFRRDCFHREYVPVTALDTVVGGAS